MATKPTPRKTPTTVSRRAVLGAAPLATAGLLLHHGAAAAESPAGRVALVEVLDGAYIERVTTDLTKIGSTPDGFRVFGTPQDEITANYLADQMRDLGLKGVRVEEMTGDGWLFEGASVGVKGRDLDVTFKASSFAGTPGTGRKPVTAQVVDVGYGTAPEYEGLDVRGKVVVAWWDPGERGQWPNMLADEATLHGARAAIIATAPGATEYSAGGGTALGTDTGTCSFKNGIPMVGISRRDAEKLKSALKRGPAKATVELKATNLPGATGYQAIGRIPGHGDPDRVIVFTAHHDAWFTGAADDTVGVAMMLALAKAVRDSGYRPHYTWVFAPVTGEEYGLLNRNGMTCYLQGAYHRVTTSHTDWRHRAVATLNWELHAPDPASPSVGGGASHEIRDVVEAALEDAVKSGTIESQNVRDVSPIADGFVYQSAGIPAVTFSSSDRDYFTRYHTDHDTLDTIDFSTVEKVLAAEVRVALDLDRPVIPYGFDSRLESLSKSLDTATIKKFGGNARAVKAAHDRLTAAWETARTAPYSASSFTAVRSAVNTAEDQLTALFLPGWTTVYPHEQAQKDIVGLSAAISALRAGQWNKALDALATVSLNRHALAQSKPAYDQQILVRSPGYPKLSWEGQGQYPLLLNLYDVTHQIRTRGKAGAKEFTEQIAQLRSALKAQSAVYRQRIDRIASVMNRVAAQLESVEA